MPCKLLLVNSERWLAMIAFCPYNVTSRTVANMQLWMMNPTGLIITALHASGSFQGITKELKSCLLSAQDTAYDRTARSADSSGEIGRA